MNDRAVIGEGKGGAPSGVSAARLVVVGAYVLVGIVLFTSPESTNVWARMAPAVALVDHGTVSIDEVIADHPTEDVSFYGGRTYSNKAPGLLLVSVPAYAAVVSLLPGRYVLATWVTQVVGTVLPTAVFLLLFHGLLLRRYGLSERRATVLVWGVAFGTLTLPYSIALFGHQTAAALVGIAVALTLLDQTAFQEVRVRTAFGSALLLGLATATDYLAAIPAVAWTGWLLAAGRPTRSAVTAWLAGALIPALALGAYHMICFGAPWRFPYSDAVLNPVFAPLVVWHWPDPAILANLTIGPRRGLFYANPLLLGILPGLATAMRRGAPAEWRVAAITLGALLLMLASWESWHGGAAVGPRYLVSALPLVALLLVDIMRRAPLLTTALATWSGLGMILVSVVGLVVPKDRADPFWSWGVPEILAGEGRTVLVSGSGASTLAGLSAVAVIAFGALLIATIVPTRLRVQRTGTTPSSAPVSSPVRLTPPDAAPTGRRP